MPTNNDDNQVIDTRPITFGLNDDLDLRTCCRKVNLAKWRVALKPGDYISIWTDGLKKFCTYRISQIEPHQDPAFVWIKFNPLGGTIDKVRLELVFPIK